MNISDVELDNGVIAFLLDCDMYYVLFVEDAKIAQSGAFEVTTETEFESDSPESFKLKLTQEQVDFVNAELLRIYEELELKFWRDLEESYFDEV